MLRRLIVTWMAAKGKVLVLALYMSIIWTSSVIYLRLRHTTSNLSFAIAFSR